MSTATKTPTTTKRRLSRDEAQLERALSRLASLLDQTEDAARELRGLLTESDLAAMDPFWLENRDSMVEDLTGIRWTIRNVRSVFECCW
jgi:ABC-type transporter Mla subunit MlaD